MRQDAVVKITNLVISSTGPKIEAVYCAGADHAGGNQGKLLRGLKPTLNRFKLNRFEAVQLAFTRIPDSSLQSSL